MKTSMKIYIFQSLLLFLISVSPFPNLAVIGLQREVTMGHTVLSKDGAGSEYICIHVSAEGDRNA